jgi:hypothetical protein
MKRVNRKSAPNVKSGRVQKQNNWDLTTDYYNTEQIMPLVDRKRPGVGYRHVLKQKDIHQFLSILPDWTELSKGLNAIVLAPGYCGLEGYHLPGVVHVCAWEDDLWTTRQRKYYERDRDIFDRLAVPCVPSESDSEEVVCQFNELQVRAYQLLRVLLHELGHHHDRMNTRSQIKASRGEPYAEEYSRKYESQIWVKYQETFELF